MDFIKTSSLRALIELTFQRNWNGLIWMRETGPDGSIEKAPNRAVRPRNECSARPKSPSVQVSAKSRITTRETCPAVGQATTTPRTTMPREPGNKASRPRNLSRTTADAPSDRETVPRPAENIGQIFIRPTSGRPRIRPATTVPTLGHDPIRPIVPTDRPTPRSTRSPF
ncbi:unnamed protein product [Microthlaspi erraticum]|uniref:Uncharacterized protein n=1 Tax=Microthlaspi erraticum TaxID=1685480 RepID=A0A6D2IR46_9BRAS|nr:unnamed protein product [Microthlaspi erraticum]